MINYKYISCLFEQLVSVGSPPNNTNSEKTIINIEMFFLKELESNVPHPGNKLTLKVNKITTE